MTKYMIIARPIPGVGFNTYLCDRTTGHDTRKAIRQLLADGRYSLVEVMFSPSSDFAYDCRWYWDTEGYKYRY
jgi:hypothetical protein